MDFEYEVAVNPNSACPSIPADAKWTGSIARFSSRQTPSQLRDTLPGSDKAVIKSCSVVSSAPLPNAVCLFEHFPGVAPGRWSQFDNRGLCSLISVASDTALLDAVVDGLPPNTDIQIDICAAGDLSNVPDSLGPAVFPAIATLRSDKFGRARAVDLVKIPFNDIIGRSIRIGHGSDTVAGIIARSAGLRENDRTLCSCSGKTVWTDWENFFNETSTKL